MQKQEFYMLQCIKLAKKGIGKVAPNPMVGCVIVYKNEIISEGYHKKYGHSHAEVNAINNVIDKSLLCKSTLYVNLEPCSHYGKTPPCANLIIKHNIPKVVIGCLDTNSKVSGKGIKQLKDNGVNVIINVLENESRNLNKRFFTFIEKRRPYIILKWAESIDGFLAPKNQNKPFWMTSNKSKRLVHQWRSEEGAIVIGRVTAEKDNPYLTVRELKGKNPIRIVIDKKLKLSNKLHLFNNDVQTIIFNEIKNKLEFNNFYIKVNFENLINCIKKELLKKDIQSIIVEGGKKTLDLFIINNLWDEARIFTSNKKLKEGTIAPKIEGNVFKTKKIDVDILKIIFND